MKQALSTQLAKSIDRLEYQGLVARSLAVEVRSRLKEGNLIQSENIADHMCAFFVPVHLESKSVFIGHHVKANMWIPPGGHIEMGEMLVDTVRREFGEELGIPFGDETVELFAATVVDLKPKPGKRCQRHWDWWHMVAVAKMLDYDYDKREFFTASWLSLDQAVKKISEMRPEFKEVMCRLVREL